MVSRGGGGRRGRGRGGGRQRYGGAGMSVGGWGCEIWRDVCGCVWAVGLWGPHGIDLDGPRTHGGYSLAGLGRARTIIQ